MARETIASLKAVITDLESRLQDSIETSLAVNKRITEMQENADNGFINSPEFTWLTKEIERLKLENKCIKDTAEYEKRRRERIAEENKRLTAEVKRLETMLTELTDVNNKRLNRGGGRPSRFTEQEKEAIKMYRLQGQTMREIAEFFNCSVGLIHKVVNEK